MRNRILLNSLPLVQQKIIRFNTITKRMHHITVGQQMVPVVSDQVNLETLDKVLAFGPFQDWARTLNMEQENRKEEMVIDDIIIQNVDWFGSNKIGFVKFKVNIKFRATGKNAPGIVFLRGGAVSMMILLQSDDPSQDDKIILTLQPRVPIPNYNFPELPAGMLDSSGDFSGTASKEIYEETGLTIHGSELVDLTELAYGDQWKGVYPSAGGSDEFLRLFLCRKKMKQQDIEDLQGKLTGLREHGENITLKLVPFKDAWKYSPDTKLLSSLALYDALLKSNKLDQ